jgi:hypothetical protein
MRKVLSIFVLLILLPVCTSFGAVGDAQGFLIDAQNSAILLTGPGVAQNTNLAVVGQSQGSSNPYQGLTALQSETGVLVQGAYIGSMGGAFGVGQAANVLAGQLQTVGGLGGPLIQDQFLNGSFAQDVARAGGIGAALGVQGFIGVQVQLIVTPEGVSKNVQYLGLGQVDSITGDG